LHSVAGGTGSGLTSRLLEELRDAYPRIFLTTVAIAPFRRGDTPLQHYNTALSLRYLQEFADAIVYRGNDDALRAATPTTTKTTAAPPTDAYNKSDSSSRQQPGDGGGATTAMMNNIMARDLAGVFFPTRPVPLHNDPNPVDFQAAAGGVGSCGPVRPFDTAALVANVCPMPSVKFLDVRSTCSIGTTISSSGGLGRDRGWDELTRQLSRTVPRHDIENGIIRSLASQVIVRGLPPAVSSATAKKEREKPTATHQKKDEAYDFSVGTPRTVSRDAQRQFRVAMRCVEETYRHVDWNPAPISALVDADGAKAALGRRSVSVCSNRTHVGEEFARVLAKGRLMHHARAYTHWYHAAGCEDADFTAAFESVEEIVQQYKHLA
jgi:hypothetical protein